MNVALSGQIGLLLNIYIFGPLLWSNLREPMAAPWGELMCEICCLLQRLRHVQGHVIVVHKSHYLQEKY